MEKEEFSTNQKIITALVIFLFLSILSFLDPQSLGTSGKQEVSSFSIAIMFGQTLAGIAFYQFVYRRLRENDETTTSVIIGLLAIHIPIVGFFALYDIMKGKDADNDGISGDLDLEEQSNSEKATVIGLTPEAISELSGQACQSETPETYEKTDYSESPIGACNSIHSDLVEKLKQASLFERIAVHPLVQPLFFKKFEGYFKGTKSGRFITVVYLLLYLTGLIALAIVLIHNWDMISIHNIEFIIYICVVVGFVVGARVGLPLVIFAIFSSIRGIYNYIAHGSDSGT